MQTMNFQCGHCRNLMAVSTEFLGQQVRCPTCGGVVIAPSAAGGPAPTPEVPRQPEPPRFEAFDTESHEDIFTQPSETDDALFGAGADVPRIDLPRAPEPAPPAPELEITPRSVVVPEAPPPETPTTGWSPLTTTATETQPQSQPQPEVQIQPPVEAPYVPSEPRRPKAAPPVDWFIPLVVLPLVLYAIGITAVAVFLYMRLVAVPPSLFDRMPDVDGDNPGVRVPKVGLQFKKSDALSPLPEHLRVNLTETLRVGDLEVTPLRLERKKVAVFVQGYPEPQECSEPSLVLRLRLKNVSAKYHFTPIDNYFDRQWDGRSGSAPLTVLVAGSNAFFGGPARWAARQDKKERREWVEGRKNGDEKGIGPGESMETVMCTDGEDRKCAVTLFGRRPYQGKLLWRVHLRRGLIEHKGRELPATCVVGVEFSSKDYGGG